MSHVDLTFHSNQHLLTLGTRKLNSTPECETTCYRYSFHNDSQVKFRNFISQFITICFTVVFVLVNLQFRQPAFKYKEFVVIYH